MTIICLIGPSGSGKTTLATAMASEGVTTPSEAITNPYKAPIPTICSYTTRPMRTGERNGREHIFIDNREAAHLLTTRHPLAYTCFGGYHYFALWEQLLTNNSPTNNSHLVSYVIDEAGFLDLENAIINYEEDMKFKDLPRQTIHTLPIFIERDAQTIASSIDPARIARDKDRPYLDLVHPAIIIHNDAPNSEAFTEWSQHFRHALRLYLTYHQYFNQTNKEVHLTTQMTLAEIIAHLNKAI